MRPIALWVVLGAFWSSSVAAAPFEEVELVEVVSGSSLVVRAGGKAQRVRVHGIESPAGDQPSAKEALAFTRKRLLAKPLLLLRAKSQWQRAPTPAAKLCVPRYPKKVKRPANWAKTSKRCLGEELLDQGLAWYLAKDGPNKEYAKFERDAKKAPYGLWKRPAPIPPWRWRKMSAAARKRHVAVVKRTVKALELATKAIAKSLRRGKLGRSLVPPAGLLVTYSGSDRQEGTSKGKVKLSASRLNKPFKMTVHSDGKGWNVPKAKQKPFSTERTFSFKKAYREEGYSWSWDFDYRKLKADATLDAAESLTLHFRWIGKKLKLVQLAMSSDDPG